jgi:transposase
VPGELFEVELIEAAEAGPTVLPASVIPSPGEALASWLLRYAAPFGVAPESLLLGDIEIALAADPDWWRKPDPLIVAAIARATGIAADVILAMTFVDWGELSRDDVVPDRFARQRFMAVKPLQRARHIGVCPQCLSDDEAPYIRRDWTLTWAACCPIHSTALVRICHECGGKLRLRALKSREFFTADRCGRCSAHLSRAPVHLLPAPVIELQRRLIEGRALGEIVLPQIGALSWPAAVALFDALLGVLWLDTRPRFREQFFARVEKDFCCEPLGDAADCAAAFKILAWMLDDWPNRMHVATVTLRAVRPRRQMQRWPHLAPEVRSEIEAILFSAWPDERHPENRAWWRAWIDNLPETGAELRRQAAREQIPHRRARLYALADVRDGVPVETAAGVAQVIPRTLYKWLRRGAEGGLEAALERPKWEYLTEMQMKELIDWISAAPPDGPQWRTNRVVNEAARRFGIEITVHVASRLLRRYGPWPRRRPKPKRRLTVAPVYD